MGAGWIWCRRLVCRAALPQSNLVPGGGAAGKNFEWPTCEGDAIFPPTTPLTPCPLSGTDVVSPVLAYGHDEFASPGDGCGGQGGAVAGGVVLRDASLPAAYLGRYIYGDYCHQCVWTAALNAGSPAAVRASIQDTGLYVGSGVRSISRDSADHVYVVHSSGWVKRVDPGPGSDPKPPRHIEPALLCR